MTKKKLLARTILTIAGIGGAGMVGYVMRSSRDLAIVITALVGVVAACLLLAWAADNA